MKVEQNKQPASDFPAGLSQPALRALANAGYQRLDQLTTVSAAELLKLHGMGPNGVGKLRAALEAKGLTFVEKMQKKSK